MRMRFLPVILIATMLRCGLVHAEDVSYSPISSTSSGPGGGTALSALTSAIAPNTIDSTSFSQGWIWSAVTTGAAFTFSAPSLTTGSALEAITTAAGNTGYAGYFANSSTSGYAIYANGPVGYASAVSIKVRTVTATGAVTVQPGSDYFICINKGTPAATTVNLPANPTTGNIYLIKDCALNNSTYNITLTPASGNIEGAATYVMHTSTATFGDIVGVVYTGSQWSLE